MPVNMIKGYFIKLRHKIILFQIFKIKPRKNKQAVAFIGT